MKVKVKYYKPIINAPDLQSRLYLRSDRIKWVNPVHEVIIGANYIATFPFEEEYCLYHPKIIDRQVQQNDFYSTIV